MIAAEVIKAVRARLGDDLKHRWDDETLLLYISLCQNDICMFTHFYRQETHLILNPAQYIYTLPTDCLAVNRLEYRNELLPVETRNNIDSGNVTYPLVLKDNLPFNEIEFKIGDVYDDLATALINVYGVTVASDDCVLEDDFGVVSDVGEDVVDPPAQPLDDVLVYYTAIPPMLTMDMTDPDNPVLPTDELILPNIWFQAFLHFVTGMALQDDNDANNIQRGEMEGGKYLRMLAHIQKTSAKDFTSNIRSKLTTNIRRV
jgi:hypothetical protein